MFTQTVQKIFHRLGYHLSRFDPNAPTSDPFVKMKELCYGIEQPVIFDVGAHHGQTTEVFRKLLPHARIYAFEPFKDSYETLLKNTAGDANIIAMNLGLSDQEGDISFHSNPNAQTNSLLATASMASRIWGKGALETSEILKAKFKTLDSVLSGLLVPSIDILKMDVQGAEHLVLKGARCACENKAIRILYTEVITLPTYENQLRLDQAFSNIFDNGFDLHSIYNLNFMPTGELRQLDALFTRSV